MKVLSGDIGGTKTSLAVIETDGRSVEVSALETFSSREFTRFDDIVTRFLDQHGHDCEQAAFGVAGPVRAGRATTTNLPWRLDAEQLAAAFGLRRVWLLNDLEANAWGITALPPEDFRVLQAGRETARGNAAVIAAGTGLGEAGLYWDGERHRPFASEGGHSDFAPATELEIELLRYLRERHGHVSWERVVSGTGLVNIHAFLSDYRASPTPSWLAEEMRSGDAAAAISHAARRQDCPLCAEAMELFVHLYGVEAGNHALKLMATGGVFLGGGIAPRILDQLEQPAFLEAFCAKGRMEALMRDMPVRVILNERTALYGPALFAAIAV